MTISTTATEAMRLSLNTIASLTSMFLLCLVLGCTSHPGDSDNELNYDAGAVDTDEPGDSEADDTSDLEETGADPDANQNSAGPDTDGPDVDPSLPEPSPHDNWSECNCPHPEDMCTPHLCGRPGIFCGPGGEECPSGYECVQTSVGNRYYCRCDGDDDECGIACESNADCPAASMSCSHDEGVCGPRTSCSSNWSCQEGFYCDGSNCEMAGELPDGSPCTHASDCFSGTCHLRCDPEEPDCEGICASQCLHDGDCHHSDEHCVVSAEPDHNGCRPWQECGGESCPDGMVCSSSECVTSDYCVTTADCETGDCVDLFLPATSFFTRRCQTYETGPESYCKPEEVFYDLGTTFCHIPYDRCYDSSDCDEPYECVGTECHRQVVLSEE